VLALAGSRALLGRAEQLRSEGSHQLALHLLDFIIDGTGDEDEKRQAMRLKSASLEQLASIETMYVSRSILGGGAERIAREIGGEEQSD
jgi:hypothetical protein